MGFGFAVLDLRESNMSFLIIDTCAKNMGSGLSKVAPGSGWDVWCNTIVPHFCLWCAPY